LAYNPQHRLATFPKASDIKSGDLETMLKLPRISELRACSSADKFVGNEFEWPQATPLVVKRGESQQETNNRVPGFEPGGLKKFEELRACSSAG